MIDNLMLLTKTTGGGLAIIATVDIANGTSVADMVREFGSFGLIVVLVLGCLWVAKCTAPLVLKSLTDTRDLFLAEIREERLSREKSQDAFREMLQSHKRDTLAALERQTAMLEKQQLTFETLIESLEIRPCQMKKPVYAS